MRTARSSCCVSCFFYFFFFQAEDGIRDLYVTGVQTCALPILGGGSPSGPGFESRIGALTSSTQIALGDVGQNSRSEEHTSELQSRRDLVCRLLLEKIKHSKCFFSFCLDPILPVMRVLFLPI